MEYIRNCKDCGLEFETSIGNKVFCNRKCKQHFHNVTYWRRAKKPYELKICKGCGIAFTPSKRSFQIFCTRKCKDSFQGKTKKGKKSRSAWQKSEKGKECHQKRRRSPEGIAYSKAYREVYWKTEHGRRIILDGNRRRRLRELNAEGWHTRDQFISMVEMVNFTCVCCYGFFDMKDLTEDHIVPLTKGGTDYIENIQPLCRPCNSKKKDKAINYLEAFMASTPDEGVLA